MLVLWEGLTVFDTVGGAHSVGAVGGAHSVGAVGGAHSV